MDGPVALSVRGVDKSYKRRQVLTNVSFDVRRGEALAIVGENGRGRRPCCVSARGYWEPIVARSPAFPSSPTARRSPA